jgi:hypothetical protein
MDLNGRGHPGATSPERLHYARPLDAGMKIALAGLVAALLAYVAEWLPPVVALETLPRAWALPAPEFLRATGMPAGWDWPAFLARGDVLTLGGIAVLATVPLLALTALVPFYAARRDWIYLAIAIGQIGVIAVAASGVLVSAH